MNGIGFDEHGGGGLVDFGSLCWGEIEIEADAGDDAALLRGRVFDLFGEDATNFFAVDEQVVGPFGLGGDTVDAEEVVNGEGGGHGEGGYGEEGGLGGEVEGTAEIGAGRGDPGAVKAAGSGGLVVGGNEGARGDGVSAEEFVFKMLVG